MRMFQQRASEEGSANWGPYMTPSPFRLICRIRATPRKGPGSTEPSSHSGVAPHPTPCTVPLDRSFQVTQKKKKNGG